MFPPYLLSFLVLLGIAHGAVLNSTVTLFLAGSPTTSIFASIVASDATATTYSLGCGTSRSEECGIETFIQGPSTVKYGFIRTKIDGDIWGSPDVEYKIGCAMGTNTANCLVAVTEVGLQGTKTTTTTEAYNSSQLQSVLRVVTITAVGSSTPTLTASAASGTASPSSTGSVTAAITSLPSTGGVPMITNAPLLFAGGAAAALAFGAM